MMLASMMDFCVNLLLLMTVCLLLSFAFCVILMRVALKDKPEVIDALGEYAQNHASGLVGRIIRFLFPR